MEEFFRSTVNAEKRCFLVQGEGDKERVCWPVPG